MNRIFYACQGCLFTRLDENETSYLNGVQSIGVDNSWDTTTIFDCGRSQPKDVLYNSFNTSLNLERVVGNYSDPSISPKECVGPFLHHIFFKDNTKPINSKDAFFIKNFGTGITGNTSKDIKEFDLSILYQTDDGPILQSSRQLHKSVYKRCLLNSISYSINKEKVLESLSFQSRSVENFENQGSYQKTQVTLGEQYSGNKIRTLIRPRDIDRTNTVLPEILNSITDTNTFFDGIEVLGITEISTEATIEYGDILNEGVWKGSPVSNNLWTTLYVPIPTRTSIKFTARKGANINFLNTPEFTSGTVKKYKIRLAFKTRNYTNTSDDLFIIDCGEKNVIQSFNISGGSTSGDLLEYEMTFGGFNDFVTYFTPANSPTLLLFTERY